MHSTPRHAWARTAENESDNLTTALDRSVEQLFKSGEYSSPAVVSAVTRSSHRCEDATVLCITLC